MSFVVCFEKHTEYDLERGIVFLGGPGYVVGNGERRIRLRSTRLFTEQQLEGIWC